MRSFATLAALLLAALTFSACTFHREIVNANTLGLDPTSLMVGETTWREAIREFGPPTIFTHGDHVRQNVSQRHLKYSCRDTKRAEFALKYLLIAPFSWSDTREVREYLLEFDENALLSGVFVKTAHSIWTPLVSEKSRAPQVTEDLTGQLTGGAR